MLDGVYVFKSRGFGLHTRSGCKGRRRMGSCRTGGAVIARGIEEGEPRLSMTVGGIHRSGKVAKKGVVDLAGVVDMMGWCGYGGWLSEVKAAGGRR